MYMWYGMAHWVFKHCSSDMKYEIDEGICCEFGLPNKSPSFAEEPGYDVRDGNGKGNHWPLASRAVGNDFEKICARKEWVLPDNPRLFLLKWHLTYYDTVYCYFVYLLLWMWQGWQGRHFRFVAIRFVTGLLSSWWPGSQDVKAPSTMGQVTSIESSVTYWCQKRNSRGLGSQWGQV